MDLTRINKAMILPIVSAIILIVKASFQLEFNDAEWIDRIVEAILATIALAGVFMKPKVSAPDETEDNEII